MEVGSISIVGKLDVSSITDSLSQLNNSLGKTKDIAKNSFGDISNLSKGLGGIVMGLAGIGVAAAGALIGLAAAGPYTAGAMARIGVAMGELERTVSAALAPAFEQFADMFQGFVTWLSGPEGNTVLELVNTTLGKIMGVTKNLEYWFGKLKPSIDLATAAMSGFLDVAFPDAPEGEPENINEEVKKDIEEETASNVLSGTFLGGVVGPIIGKILGVGATGFVIPAAIMGAISMAINSIVEPMKKGAITGMVNAPGFGAMEAKAREDAIARDLNMEAYDESRRSLLEKLNAFTYDMDSNVPSDTNNVNNASVNGSSWIINYPSENSLLHEFIDKSGYTGRYIGDYP